MSIRILLAAGVAALAVATPAAAYDYAALAQHSAGTGATTSVVPPTTSAINVSRPITISQAIAKGIPSAYGSVTSYRSCSVEAIGDVSFIKITECSVITDRGFRDTDTASGYVNLAATTANVTLPGRRITVCVNAYVTPRVGASFYSGRVCGSGL